MSRKTVLPLNTIRFVTTLLLTNLIGLSLLSSPISAEGLPQADGTIYTVQADDWLSKLSEKFYGDVLAFPAIVEATNARATEDDSFAVIDNPDVIEIGQKLLIPTAQEASTILGQLVPFLSGDLTIYSGRSESLVGPLLAQFEAETGLNVEVRYGDTAGMAATILEEGANSPADIYYGQDAGALGALAKTGRLTVLPDDILSRVEPRFRAASGQWVGTSGRARTVVYNTNNLTEADLPDDLFGFCDPQWRGRLGWAPTNGSFQAFVTALRVSAGEERAAEWLACVQANEPQVFSNNTSQVEAAGKGEIDIGFVNHYYLYRFLAENPDFPARNYHPRDGGVGAMINVAGLGIVDSTDNPEAAEAFVRFLLRPSSQQYFNEETNEYPLASDDITLNPLLTPLSDISTPDLDLSDLDDLEGTLQLLQSLGIL